MPVNLKDLGGKLMLERFFSTAVMWLDLFVSPAAQTDSQGMLNYELCEGPDTYEVDFSAVAYAVGLTNGTTGVPQVEWMDVTFEFTAPLTNPSGNLKITGYRVTVDDTVLYDEMLPDGGMTPNVGERLTISPQFLLGNTSDPL